MRWVVAPKLKSVRPNNTHKLAAPRTLTVSSPMRERITESRPETTFVAVVAVSRNHPEQRVLEVAQIPFHTCDGPSFRTPHSAIASGPHVKPYTDTTPRPWNRSTV